MASPSLDYRHLTLRDAEAESATIAEDAAALFGGLDVRQLNWRPDATRWSVAQCFDHLLHANRQMLVAMDRAVDARVPRTIWQRLPVVPGLMGGLLIRSLSPDVGRRFKAPRSATPAESAIDADVVTRFVLSQAGLQAWFRELAEHDVSRVVMISPFAATVAYSVLDGCRIIVTHQRRHVEQARRVTGTAGFPARG